MKHHTKDKGDIGVGFTIADLTSKGISICIPLSEHLPFDLVGIYPDGTIKKISVKYRSKTKGTIYVKFSSCYSDSNGSHIKKINKNMIDIIAIYCPDTMKVYYTKPSKKEGITLRIDNTKNNQKKKIFFANKYLSPFI